MAHVQVTHDEHVIGVLGQLGHTHQHTLQEAVLIFLLLGADLAGVHVRAHHGQGLPVRQNVVGLNPASRVIKVLLADGGAGCHGLILQQLTGRVRGAAGSHQHARAALSGGLGVQNIPLRLVEELTHDGVGRANLLQAEDVDVSLSQPVGHVLAVGGADAVDVDARHAEQTGLTRNGRNRRMHSLNYASMRGSKNSP